MGRILASGALAAWRATAMLHTQPHYLEERWEATCRICHPLPCSIPSLPPTSPTRRVLANTQIRLCLEVRRQWLHPPIPSGFLLQPYESFLHKPLYPLVAMTTTEAHGRGSLGDRHAVSQE